jgi:hypothetical protein
MHPLHSSPSYPLLTITGIVSKNIIFPFTCMCTQYLYHIHPSMPFLYLLPPPTSTNPLRQDLFSLKFRQVAETILQQVAKKVFPA